MNASLHLDRSVLIGDPEILRELLLAHVRCARSATAILLVLLRERGDPEVSYCVVHPCAEVEDAVAPGCLWRLRVVRAGQSVSREGAPGTARNVSAPPRPPPAGHGS